MNIEEAIKILGEGFRFSMLDTNPVIQELNLPKNAKLLDVGTGKGTLAIMLALNGYEVITGEPKEDKTIYANQDWLNNSKKVKVDHQITFQSFDAKNTFFETGFFDAVFAQGSLHHIDEDDRVKVIREFERITKPDGLFCFFEPNRQTIDTLRIEDPTHPDGADPIKYLQNPELTYRIIKGTRFDAFIINKKGKSK